MRLVRSVVAAVMLLLGLGSAAWAKDAAWASNDQGEVGLVAAVSAVGDSGRVQMGLSFKLKPGWKIYWRSPGDAGLPPTVDWKGSDNLSDVEMSWPGPERFSIAGLETVGYKDEVVLPFIALLNDPAQPLSLRAAVDYLACDVICVPLHVDLALDLPTGPAASTPEAHVIGRFLSAVPGQGAAKGLTLIRAAATDDGMLKVVVGANPPLTHPDLLVERVDQMQFTKPTVRLDQGGRRVVFLLKPVPKTGEGDLRDKPVTLTVVEGERGMEVVADIQPPEPGSRMDKFFAMLGAALAGGFILNLMPCVLPVLSIKVLSLIGHAGAERRHIRAGFLASAAGILVSFLALAAAAIGVKAAGSAVGWGIQFQQPLFLVLMGVITTLFAANLFGLFEIGLPHWLSGGGRGLGDPHSLAAHFGAGMFATLLATPCSAPFLGTAVGFALSRGTVEILAIFTALGLGMASPYLAVAVWPHLAQRLPRPGRWMLVLRKVLGLVMLGTAAWLLVVLAAEAGDKVGMTVGSLLGGLLLFLAVARRITGWARLAGAAALILGAVAITHGPNPRTADAAPEHLKSLWKPFDRDGIPKLVADGKVVFVDVTADWCITCQVNKATVVYRGKVAERLATPGIVAMQADWTRPDEAIGAYLASFGRYGIPFNAVYGPGAPDGLPLPELLDEDTVLEALEKAKKGG